MKNPPLLRSLAIVSTCALLLAGCGGGGGGGSSAVFPPPIRPTTALGSSAQYAERCDAENQKKFVRTYLDEVYLWYNEIVDVDMARFPRVDQVDEYFDALLVRTPDATGQPKDRFSAILPTFLAQDLTRRSLAAAQSAAPDTAQSNHSGAVPEAKTVTTASGRKVGYIRFNNHDIGAQDDLIAAFRQIQAANVQDLVLDLRFNTGGFLYVAQTAASMIVGPTSEGQIFERLQYNDKRPEETAQSTFLFSSRVQTAETQNAAGTPLPQLGLPRVFVLTTSSTCSASESIINGLRGIDVQVVLIGATTCGKPYGFHEKTNCGWSLFPNEYKGTNAKGAGEYVAGIAPTCPVADNSGAVAPGSASDSLLSGALTFIETGACPAATAAPAQAAGTPAVAQTRGSQPPWFGRLLLPQPQR